MKAIRTEEIAGNKYHYLKCEICKKEVARNAQNVDQLISTKKITKSIAKSVG